MNLSAVAKHVGMPTSVLHDWVKGRRVPSLRNLKYLRGIAEYLKITLSELLEGQIDQNVLIRKFDFEDGDSRFVLKIEKRNGQET